MPSLRWLTAGLIPTAIIAVLVIRLLSSAGATDGTSVPTGSESTAPSSVAVASPTPSPTVTPVLLAATATVAATSDPTVVPVEVIDPTGSPAPEPTAAAVAPTSATPVPVVAQTSMRLTIPSIGVNAPVDPLAFDGAGGYAVPNTAGGVGWYNFSARPGAAGNAVFGGHLNWRGSSGVFDQLDGMTAGDLIYVDSGDGQLVFRVVRTYTVSATSPFINILGERKGPSTLTLFTCGGSFDSSAGGYDERTVVDAVQISA